MSDLKDVDRNEGQVAADELPESELRGEAPDTGAEEEPALIPELEVDEVESADIGEPVTTSAVVPALPAGPMGRFQGTITRFLERVMPTPSVEIPPEIGERLDALEVQIAGLEELLTKRLEEGEGRTLHLVEKRLEVQGEDVARLARRTAEQEVAAELQALRLQTLAIGGLAVGLAAAALVWVL